VQSIVFCNGTYDFGLFPNAQPVFRAEAVATRESFNLGAYYLKRIYTYIQTEWGLRFQEDASHKHLVGLKGAVYLSLDRYFIRPFLGVDTGLNVYPKTERNLFSHSLIGADIQFDHHFGMSARETWSFSNNPFHPLQPFRFRLENAMFEVVFYWQI